MLRSRLNQGFTANRKIGISLITDKQLTSKRTLRNRQPVWAVSADISVASREHCSRSDFDVIIVGAGHCTMRTSTTRNAGFTMIEVLVAFVVLAVLAIAVDRAVVASLASSTRAETRIQSEMVARTLISGPLGVGPDAVKPKSGRMNGLDWSVRFELVSLPFASAQAGEARTLWVPMKMVVRVSDRSSSKLDLTVAAVRLVNVVAQ